MPDKYTKKPVEEHKIDYGTAKSHYANVRFKQGLPRIAGGDIRKGTEAYNEVVLLQKSLKEKDFVLLVAELADKSPEHWHMMSKYFEKRGFETKIAGQVLAYAKTIFGESKGPLDSISNLAIAGGGGGPIQEAPKPLPPPLVKETKPVTEYGYLWNLENTFDFVPDEYFTKYFPYNPSLPTLRIVDLLEYIDKVSARLKNEQDELEIYDELYPGGNKDDKNELKETIKILKDEKNKKTKFLNLYEQQKEDWQKKYSSK